MRVESQVVNAGRETASDEVWVRILESRLENVHNVWEWEEPRTVHWMISRLTRPVLRLGSGRVTENDIQPIMHGK